MTDNISKEEHEHVTSVLIDKVQTLEQIVIGILQREKAETDRRKRWKKGTAIPSSRGVDLE